MDYKDKYEQALKKARIWKDKSGMPKDKQGILDDIFPELKESEDEKIRKELVAFVESRLAGFPKCDRFIAWLEKQAPVEHLELKTGHWYMCHRAYCCRADSLTIREGERLMCEKDGVVKGFAIKDPEKYFIEVHAPAPIEDDQNDKVRRRSTIQILEYARSLDAYNQYGKADIDKNIAWLEKQEQNPTDNVGDTVKDPFEEFHHVILK